MSKTVIKNWRVFQLKFPSATANLTGVIIKVSVNGEMMFNVPASSIETISDTVIITGDRPIMVTAVDEDIGETGHKSIDLSKGNFITVNLVNFPSTEPNFHYETKNLPLTASTKFIF